MLIPSRRYHLLALGCIILAVALVAARLSLLQGFATIVRIEGASMSPGLQGEHTTLVCPGCRHTWPVDAIQWQQVATTICCDCGASIVRTTEQETSLGQRVIIDRAAYLFARPRRFDVVAFAHPSDQGQTVVKRIVALPGEEWAIQHGDLYVDGRLVRKSYPQFRASALLVSGRAAAWTSENSAWQFVETEQQWNSSGANHNGGANVNWLIYKQLATHPAAIRQPTAVQDYDAYNPAVARELNDVVDLLAEAEIIIEKSAPMELRIHDGYADLVVEYDRSAGRCELRRNEQVLARTPISKSDTSTNKIAWGICDRRLFFAVDDRLTLQYELEEMKKSAAPVVAPLGIRLAGEGEVRIRNLRISRDIYYLDAAGRSGDWHAPHTLGQDEYALLGDNPPLSIDSREADHGVPRHDILGPVFAR